MNYLKPQNKYNFLGTFSNQMTTLKPAMHHNVVSYNQRSTNPIDSTSDVISSRTSPFRYYKCFAAIFNSAQVRRDSFDFKHLSLSKQSERHQKTVNIHFQRIHFLIKTHTNYKQGKRKREQQNKLFSSGHFGLKSAIPLPRSRNVSLPQLCLQKVK